MKKVYLFCSAGMSTSLLAANMQKAANEHGLPVEIKAYPYENLDEIYEENHPDCILLGPQVRFMLHDIQKRYEPKGIPVASIEPSDYGTMNGENVLKAAIMLIKQNKR